MEVFDPRDLIEKLGELKSGLDVTDASVKACTGLAAGTRAGWDQFYKDAQVFYYDAIVWAHGLPAGVILCSPLTLFGGCYILYKANAAEDGCKDKLAKLVAWQKTLGDQGCKLLGPPADLWVDHPPGAPNWVTGIKWGAIGVASIAAVVLVGPIVKEAVDVWHASRAKPAAADRRLPRKKTA